jgi:hypothetical protein
VGSKLEVVPADPQHGKPGDWVFVVSAFKTPPRPAAPEGAHATPAALTAGRVLLAPGGTTPTPSNAAAAAAAAADGEVVTPAMLGTLLPAADGCSVRRGTWGG